MPVLSVDQLIKPLSQAQARAVIIGFLKSIGFSGAASWQEGSLPRTLGVEAPAYLLWDLTQNIANIAKAGFNDTAEKAFLTLHSISNYDNDREPGVRTVGMTVLTALASAPPNVFAPGDIIASDGTGKTFRNTGSGTLTPGGTLSMELRADAVGAAYNIPVNTLTYLHTTLVGVSINNPPGADGQWVTTWGADEEKDEELRVRNKSKWATLAYAKPSDAYVFWALEASPVVTRATVLEGDALHPGAVNLYVAGIDGTLAQPVADAVTDYINGVTDGIVRRPLGAQLQTVSAVAHPINVSGTVWIDAAYQTTAPPQVQAQIDALFETLPIGGDTAGGSTGLLFSKLYRAAMTVPGVINVHFDSPTGDVPLVANEVATSDPASALTFEIVG